MPYQKSPLTTSQPFSLEGFVSSQLDGVIIIQSDGTILGLDEEAAHLLQSTKEALKGNNILKFIPKLQLPEVFSTVESRGRALLQPADATSPRQISYLLRGGWQQLEDAYFLLLHSANSSLEDLKLYSRLFDWMPVGIVVYNLAQEVPIMCNRRLLELFEADDAEAFLYDGPLSLKADNPLKMRLNELRRSEGKRFEMEFPVPEREALCLEVTTSIIPGMGDEHLLLLFQNITDRNSNARRLRESQNPLQAIIGTAVDGIIIIDARGTIQMVNEATIRLFGYAEEEMLNQNIKMLMPQPHRGQHDGYLANYRQTGEERIIGTGREVQGQRKNGELFPFRLGVSRVDVAEGMLFTGVIHDLTEQKKAEQKILRLNRELEQKVEERTEKLTEVVNKLLQSNLKLEQEIKERKAAEDALRQNEEELRRSLEREKELSELKSRFVSMASHEFRTPLTTIASSTELVGLYTNSDQQPKREKHLKRIQSAVTNLTGILGDFLSLSKLEEGKIKNVPTEFQLHELLDEITDDVHTLLKKEQRIDEQYHNVDHNIVLDQKILKNIFINLLSNAIKYSGAGSTITLQVKLEQQLLKVRISDEGIGIPQSEQKHLFSRFFRAENAVNIQGTGLGLNIVKRYLDLLDGDIGFESEEGAGTTFFFEVPVAPAPAE